METSGYTLKTAPNAIYCHEHEDGFEAASGQVQRSSDCWHVWAHGAHRVPKLFRQRLGFAEISWWLKWEDLDCKRLQMFFFRAFCHFLHTPVLFQLLRMMSVCSCGGVVPSRTQSHCRQRVEGGRQGGRQNALLLVFVVIDNRGGICASRTLREIQNCDDVVTTHKTANNPFFLLLNPPP